MTDQQRGSRTDIFRTKEPLSKEFTPNHIIERDEFSEFYDALAPMVSGHATVDLMVFGPKGSGKTTITNHMLDLLSNEFASDERTLQFIHIDCNEDQTIYQILLHLVNDCSDTQYKQGTHPFDLWEECAREFEKLGDQILLIFENLDSIRPDENPFEEFGDLPSTFEMNANIGIIGIYDGLDFASHLGLSTRRSPGYYEIEFTPYKANELREILEVHANQSFFEGTLDEDVIPKCAAVIAQISGDAQSALDLLMLSGEVAIDQGAANVTVSHVDQAKFELEQKQIRDVYVENLSHEEQLVTLVIAFYELCHEDPITFDMLFEKYQEYCSQLGLNQVGQRRVRQFIRPVMAHSLIEIETHNEGSRGGIWLTYPLLVSPTTIVEAAKEAPLNFEKLIDGDIELALDEFENQDNYPT